MSKTLFPLTVLLLLTLNSFAQTERKAIPIRLLIRGGLELGGDEVAEVYFTNGNTQSVRAGQGGTIALGAQLQFPQMERLLFYATVGFKYVTTEADNVHVRLTRVPIQLTANWMAAKRLRIGGGLSMHTGIRFKADGIGDDITFHNAKGPTIEVAYAGIGLSYTAMKYKDQANHTYSANAVGLTFTATIPNK